MTPERFRTPFWSVFVLVFQSSSSSNEGVAKYSVVLPRDFKVGGPSNHFRLVTGFTNSNWVSKGAGRGGRSTPPTYLRHKALSPSTNFKLSLPQL